MSETLRKNISDSISSVKSSIDGKSVVFSTVSVAEDFNANMMLNAVSPYMYNAATDQKHREVLSADELVVVKKYLDRIFGFDATVHFNENKWTFGDTDVEPLKTIMDDLEKVTETSTDKLSKTTPLGITNHFLPRNTDIYCHFRSYIDLHYDQLYLFTVAQMGGIEPIYTNATCVLDVEQSNIDVEDFKAKYEAVLAPLHICEPKKWVLTNTWRNNRKSRRYIRDDADFLKTLMKNQSQNMELMSGMLQANTARKVIRNADDIEPSTIDLPHNNVHVSSGKEDAEFLKKLTKAELAERFTKAVADSATDAKVDFNMMVFGDKEAKEIKIVATE